VPFRARRSSQNVRPALKWLACPNCHGRAVRIGLVTHHHLFLRCDDCGEPLSLPERRRSARKLSKIP
jgi:RNase P subunit RPR2